MIENACYLSFSLVELLLSVNGDTTSENGLRATKRVPNAGYFIVLSVSATVHLEPWQTLYLMIRGTGAGSLEVVNGSTFGVALIGTRANLPRFTWQIKPCKSNNKKPMTDAKVKVDRQENRFWLLPFLLKLALFSCLNIS